MFLVCLLTVLFSTSIYIQDFITAGVTAYAIGCTDEGLRGELLSMRDSDEDVIELSSGGSTGVKLKITSEEVRFHISIFSVLITCLSYNISSIVLVEYLL